MPSVDLLTPCRNRAECLRRSLPSWLACAQLRRIVVVDFASSTPVSESLGDIVDERITIVRVEDEPLWRQGRAQNVGLGLVAADLVLKIDADIAVVDLSPYIEQMTGNESLYYRGFARLGTSSGLCLAPTSALRAMGGYHDYMSGWGGDDVDLNQRLRRCGFMRQYFRPESFSEQHQRMAGKNAEAPRLDSQLLEGHEQLARNPWFTGFRNTVLARVLRQKRRHALRWRYTTTNAAAAGRGPQLVQARLRNRQRWRLALGRHSIELANILALARYGEVATPWELIRSEEFSRILSRHQLPRCRSARDRQVLLRELPARFDALRKLASELGVTCPARP